VAAKRNLTRGERNCAWIEEHCRVPEGALVGQNVKLRHWQRDIIKGIYDTPTRRAIISFGRKNGKTALSAFLLLLHLVGPEARANSQLYSAAQSREQASILFALAAKVVRQSPDLSQYVVVRDTAKQLFCQELGTLYRALSAEASTAYGLSPAFAVHDELGQVKGPRSELYEAIETGAGAQEAPLSIVISTQAPTDADLLSVLIDDALAAHDPETKVWIFSADESLDPFSDEAIIAANPAFGDFQNPKEVRAQAETAKRMPSAEAGYRNLILNQRVNLSNPLLSRTAWESCGGVPSPLEGKVYLGLDLSAIHDLTALSAVCEAPDGSISVHTDFFTPANGLRDRAHRDREPYDVWEKDGLIHAVPGSAIDLDWVVEWARDNYGDRDIAGIWYDRWRFDVFQASLKRANWFPPVFPFGQGFKDMTPAVQRLETLVAEGRLRHGMNPVLTMCARNAVAVRDPAGGIKLDKSKATGRIDGLVALSMALGGMALGDTREEPKKYQLMFF